MPRASWVRGVIVFANLYIFFVICETSKKTKEGRGGVDIASLKTGVILYLNGLCVLLQQ